MYGTSRSGVSVEKQWTEAVLRFVRENVDKRYLSDDKDHLRKLDAYLRDRLLSQINMDTLWPFIHDHRERDGVMNSTINRALEIVWRVLQLARDEWQWLQRFSRSYTTGTQAAYSHSHP